MYALRTPRGNTRLLLIFGLAYALATGCKKEDAQPRQAASVMQVVLLTDTLPAVITQPTLLTNAHPWFINGWLYVSNEASLTLEAGTQVYALPANERGGSGMIITRGSKIIARGTAQFPVVFHLSGKGSGLVLLGKAPVDKQGLYDKLTWPAGQKLSYGGLQPADSSGSLQNVQLFYSSDTAKNRFSGGLLLLGVGRKTQLDNVLQLQRPAPVNLTTRKLK